MLIQGLLYLMGLSALYGLASFFPEIYVINITTGISFSGIFMNIIRYLILYLFYSPNETKEKEFIESLLYYSVSTFVCLICLILIFIIYKNEYFISKLKYTNEINNKNNKNNNNNNNNDDTNDINIDYEKDNDNNNNKNKSLIPHEYKFIENQVIKIN
jgi:hypothetical protein